MAKYEIKDGVGIIPEGTTSVLPSAFDAWKFDDATELKSVQIPECVENDGDTTKFDNDVVSVLKHTEEWHLYANEVNYDEAGIWVHNDDEYPFHFTVVKKGGEVVMEYL